MESGTESPPNRIETQTDRGVTMSSDHSDLQSPFRRKLLLGTAAAGAMALLPKGALAQQLPRAIFAGEELHPQD